MDNHNAAGDNIAAYCTRCKLSLDHTIVAMDNGRIAKVTCRTCGSTHTYRTAPGQFRRATSSEAGSGKKSVQSAQERWQEALAGTAAKPKPYAMDGKYQEGDVISHDRFGKGVVVKVMEKKCAVLFQDQERLMAAGV